MWRVICVFPISHESKLLFTPKCIIGTVQLCLSVMNFGRSYSCKEAKEASYEKMLVCWLLQSKRDRCSTEVQRKLGNWSQDRPSWLSRLFSRARGISNRRKRRVGASEGSNLTRQDEIWNHPDASFHQSWYISVENRVILHFGLYAFFKFELVFIPHVSYCSLYV